MIALIQRVSHAQVSVDGEIVGRIDAGLLALIGVQPQDDAARAERLVERMLGYRVFSDAAGKMNLSLRDTGGGLLLVPQFTLAADTRKGTRAGFSTAAAPEVARTLFEVCVARAKAQHARIETGRFGADMSVALVNEGPVTFWLDA